MRTRKKLSMKGPYTFEEWVRIYEERDDSKYVLEPGEQVCWDPEHGFFTFWYDARNKLLCIPKMCGNGRFWRKKIFEMAQAAGKKCVDGVYCCTKRDPKVYMRVLGGKLVKQEPAEKGRTISYILISWDDTKEGRE